MSYLSKSLKSLTVFPAPSGLDSSKIIGLVITVGLGILLGYLHSASQESAEITVSVVVIIATLLLIVNKPLNGLLLLFLFMAFIEEYVKLPMGAGIPDLSFSRFVIAFLFIVMLARAAIGKLRVVRPIGLTELCIIAATLGIMSSATLDSEPTRTMQFTITRYFTPLIMYFFARNLIQNKKDLDKLLWAMMLFGLAAAVYAIYEVSTGHILFVGKEGSANLRTDLYGDNFYLIRGLLNRAANFGRVFTSTIPIAFYLFFEDKNIRRRLFLAAVLLIQFYAMFLTYNRTSWIALLIGLAVLQLFYPQFRKVFWGLVLVAVVVLWATWDQLNESDLVNERVTNRVEDFNGRTQRWDAAFNMWEQKPIRGWGLHAFEMQSGRFREDGSRQNFRAIESEYLTILVSHGLIGFIPFMFFLIVPLINSFRLFARARAPDWSGFVRPQTIALYWCVILTFAITSYTQTQNQPIVKMIPFAVAGAVVGTHLLWLRPLTTNKDAVSGRSMKNAQEAVS